MKQRNPLALFIAWLGLATVSVHPVHAADGGAILPQVGSISGSVSSVKTGNMLQGALVELPVLNRRVTTDSGGRFTVTGLPLGPLEIIVSYTGFKEERRTVMVGGDDRRALSFELSSAEVVMLEKFTVASEREGNSLALTSQRNAPNLKNIVAMDAFGKRPNMGVGELVSMLPGVAPTYGAEGNVQVVSIRGMPSNLTTTTVDGNPLFRGNGARTISYAEMEIPGIIYEQVELTKGHLPDQSANSLGGGVNLKTRSPLSMKEKRRMSYSLSARWAPPFLEHQMERRAHPVDGIINLSYLEAFDVGGGERNLGVVFSVFRGENILTANHEVYNYQNIAASPAYIYDYRSISHVVNRQNTAGNLKFEYRPGPTHKFFLSMAYTQGDNPATDQSTVRFATSQTIATLDSNGQPTGTGAILPGFTDVRTQVRGVAASIVELTNSHQTFATKTPSVSIGGEHKLGRWDLDYKVAHTSMHIDRGVGGRGDGGVLVMSAANVGWRIDRANPNSPTFVQTEGRSIYDPTGYYARPMTFTRRIEIEQSWSLTSELNAAYRLATLLPTTLKSGLAFERRQNNRTARNNTQFTRLGSAAQLPNALPFITTFDERQGGRIPLVDARTAYTELSQPGVWSEDLYYRGVQKLSQTRSAVERVEGAYVMGQTKFDRLGLVTGVRVERTELTGNANIRVKPATAAEIPDPAARAIHDWNHPTRNKGDYTRSFPSIHLTYDVTNDFKARASWSTSFGRPDFGALVPSASVNDTAQTVTVNNPALGPQYAKNIDVSLEYFLKPAGTLRLGYFEKSINDYILTSDIGMVASGRDNGYDGDYAGYTLRTSRNAGTAEAKGWEIDYRQQFPFLPGLLKGLEMAGNFTTLKTSGNFGGTAVTRDKEVPGFIPKAGNVSVVYSYLRFGTRVTYSYLSDYLRTFNATPQLRIYAAELKTVNWSVSYRWRPAVTFSCDFTNVFAARPLEQYQYIPIRTNDIGVPHQTISFQVSGNF